jgi:hypothetical protein
MGGSPLDNVWLRERVMRHAVPLKRNFRMTTMRAFHLAAKAAVRAHPEWNGCAADRRCEVWAEGGEERARALAHARFFQEATPVKPDRGSPWTDPEMVECAEIPVPATSIVPAEETVFGWDDRVLALEGPEAAKRQTAPPNPDPSKKLDQH